jgi:excinuclease ABC subunit A
MELPIPSVKRAPEYIEIKGAKLHNLKNIDLKIPRNKLVVITGLSGSGKSTLAFDTLYAEGQRKYVESLSAYARQFLGKLDKPDVEYIKGISPAIAIEQKVTSRNPRSTVGTTTEIYDYMKVLFARIGQTYSPVSGKLVQKHNTSDVIDAIKNLPEGNRFLILAPLVQKKGQSLATKLEVLMQQGFARVSIDNQVYTIEEALEQTPAVKVGISIVVDRAITNNDPENLNRIADSLETAFFEGHGFVEIFFPDTKEQLRFSNLFEADGISFEEPSLHLFSFNNPYGACPKCEGFGSIIGVDEDLVVPNPYLSIYEDAVVCWKGEKMQEWKFDFLRVAAKMDFPIHTPYIKLTEDQKSLLWEGKKGWPGIEGFFKFLESQTFKIQYRVMLSRYRGKTKCPECKGSRLRKEARYVKINGRSIQELVDLSIDDLGAFFLNIELSEFEATIAKRLLTEIRNRISYLQKVGLGYLTLNRVSSSLSGGESQRINLATSLGSSLVGSMYILDEPSIGLHPADTERLIDVLKSLRNLGNTVIVVEHDEEIMKAADYLIDIGPEAGTGGGEVVFEGTPDNLASAKRSYTAKYLYGQMQIPVPTTRRKPGGWLRIFGAMEHNLKNIDVQFPIGTLTVVTGVSGSGKSTLVRNILYPALQKAITGYGERPGKFQTLEGDYDSITHVEFVDQNPIGKSSRSNPVTYLKVYDDIRLLYAGQKLAQFRNLTSKHFSFNTDGGRCDTCQGEGTVTIEMQFMADVTLKCEGCGGKRFKEEVLEVKYSGKNIYDILELTVDEAIEFFDTHGHPRIVKKLMPLKETGLGYVHLGQSSSTLSGGEAQRIKLATFLAKGAQAGKTMFIFDEPTTGLHFHDINKLLKSFEALLENGHSILVVEHNPDVIKCADWIVDLGPVGGQNGGYLIYSGVPEDFGLAKDSVTAPYILDKLGN